MIFGTGIDITTISRFEKWISNEKFCNKYFAEEELEYIHGRGKGAVQSLAAGFAAKEAFGKALGTGIGGLNLKGITVLRNINGKPYIKVIGKVLGKLNSCGENPRIHLSLSHESQLAIAQVIIEVDND